MFTLRDAGGIVTLGDTGGDCHPQGWRRDRLECRLWWNDDGECRLSNGAFEYFGEVNDGLLLSPKPP